MEVSVFFYYHRFFYSFVQYEIRFFNVGYLTSGFECFPGGFAQAVDQTKHKVDQHTTRRVLFDTFISFLK